MYQPYDPYLYQPYNDPQPEHYASTVPGMPQPARPNAFTQADQSYIPYQDQYFGSTTSYNAPPYGAQAYPAQPNFYPSNSTSSSQEEQYPLSYGSLTHSSSNHYPPLAHSNSNQYPLSSAAYPTQNVAPGDGISLDQYSRMETPYPSASFVSSTENTWAPNYPPNTNTTPIPRPQQGTSHYDANHPKPYGRLPSDSSLITEPHYGKQDHHHDGVDPHGGPLLHNTIKLERQDNLGCGPEREKPQPIERQEFSSHAVPKREEKKESVSFSVEEAQLIIKQLKEKVKNLSSQLSNSREAASKVAQEKDVVIEQLQKETDALRGQSFIRTDHHEAVAVVEREWMQKLSSQELKDKQELLAQAEKYAEAVTQIQRDWEAKCSRKEQENAVLLARVNKLQSDSEDGRAFLLETNAAQEAELMKLREETAQLLDETTQLVDERDNARNLVKQLEVEKRAFEERLSHPKSSSAEFMAEKDAIVVEQRNLAETAAALEKELEEYRNVCEERRLRIEELENEELPSLRSELELETRLHEKTKDMVTELEGKLEDCRNARDSLEKQLFAAEKREMEVNLRVAGDSRSAAEELERLRSQLDSHMLAKADSEKWISELESEKMTLEEKASQLEGELRHGLDRISTLEKSLEDVTAMRDELQETLGLCQETLERETQEHEDMGNSLRSDLEKLQTQVSTLTSAKGNLESRATQLQAEKVEVEQLLNAAEEMLNAVKEELQNTEVDNHAAGKGSVELEKEKTLLEGKLADLEKSNAQMSKQITDLTEQVKLLEEEKSKLEIKIDAQDNILVKIEEELAENEAELQKLWGEAADYDMVIKKDKKELERLRLELGKDKKEMDRLRDEVLNLTKAKEELKERIMDLEEYRRELEARNVVILEDKRSADVNASTLRSEYKDLQDRFSAMSLQYAEVRTERDELVLSNRKSRTR